MQCEVYNVQLYLNVAVHRREQCSHKHSEDNRIQMTLFEIDRKGWGSEKVSQMKIVRKSGVR